jgi:hypothetical protein
MGVQFVVVDDPHGRQADHPHLGGCCRTRARAISERIKAALAAAKARGSGWAHPDPAGAMFRSVDPNDIFCWMNGNHSYFPDAATFAEQCLLS